MYEDGRVFGELKEMTKEVTRSKNDYLIRLHGKSKIVEEERKKILLVRNDMLNALGG